VLITLGSEVVSSVQIGRHTSEHAMNVADTGCLASLAAIESAEWGEDLRGKCRRALKAVVSKLMHLPPLIDLIQSQLSDSVTRLVLEQLGKVVAVDAVAKAALIHSGGFSKIQEIAGQPDSRHKDLVAVVNSQYPEEVVRYYSPLYSEQLLHRLGAGLL
jgi:hypothetical protein